MSITVKNVDGVTITTIDGTDLEQLKAGLIGHVPPGHCVNCSQPFSAANVRTPAGWKETELSHLCENCWDAMMAEPEPGADAARVDQAMRDVDRILGDAEESGFDDE